MCKASIERIMNQNNKETKYIYDRIEAIEQRVKSEKVMLLAKLVKLKENK